jgi:hypothetical protein
LMAYIEKVKRADAIILGISKRVGVPRRSRWHAA